MSRSFRLTSSIAAIVVFSLALAPARAGLDEDIQAVLKDKLLQKGEAGVAVLQLAAGQAPNDARIVFRHNSDVPLVPASNLKLVTTSTALETLGKDFKFHTILAQRGTTLAIIGDGDPTLGDAEMLKKVGWDSTTVFRNWADLLRKAGVARVSKLYVDDSVFDQQFAHPNWPANQEQKRYVAQVAGLNFNANCVDFYIKLTGPGEVVNYLTDPPATRYITVKNRCIVGKTNGVAVDRERGTNNIALFGEAVANNDVPVSVTVDDPALFAGMVLGETLSTHGVHVDVVERNRTIRSTLDHPGDKPTTQPAWTILAIHETPLKAVLARANKDSMNLYAEALCKRIGFAATGESGSWENGHKVIADFLTRLAGVSSAEFNLDDGCGLSKKNTVSANCLAQVLRYNFRSANRQSFIDSLAVAGVDGTFERRFEGTNLGGRVFGKSGYVGGVSSLSGYLRARDGNWYAFSILFNGIPEGMNLGAKQLQEKIVKAIDQSTAITASAR